MLNIRICYEVEGYIMGSSHRLANIVYDRLFKLSNRSRIKYELEMCKISPGEDLDLTNVGFLIFCDVGEYHLELIDGFEGGVMYVDSFEKALDSCYLYYTLEDIYKGLEPEYVVYLDRYSIVDSVTYELVEVDINSYEWRSKYKKNPERYVKISRESDLVDELREYLELKIDYVKRDIETYNKLLIRKVDLLGDLELELSKLGGV